MDTIFTEPLQPVEALAAFALANDAVAKYNELTATAADNHEQLQQPKLLAYEHLKSATETLLYSLSTFDVVPVPQHLIREHLETFARNERSLQSLKAQVGDTTHKDHGTRMNQLLDDHEKHLENLLQLVSEQVIPVLTEHQDISKPQPYSPSYKIVPNQEAVVLDYRSPVTPEGQLRSALMAYYPQSVFSIALFGVAGIGKSVALRGLGKVYEIINRFPGGYFYVPLGKDASIQTVIEAIASFIRVNRNVSLADKLKGYDSLEQAVKTASVWFRNRKCLFLIDDVWLVNGITASLPKILAQLFDTSSCLIYTTRESALTKACDRTIKMFSLEAEGETARMMMLRHSQFDREPRFSDENEKALQGLLQMCNGLPRLIGLVGETVGKDSRRRSRNLPNALRHMYRIYSSKTKRIATKDREVYTDRLLDMVVDVALDVLQAGTLVPAYGREGLVFEQYFRALCVLESQQVVPRVVIRNLCGLANLARTDDALSDMHDLRLLTAELRNDREFMYVNDQMHELAVRRASKRHEVHKFWRVLIYNYICYDRALRSLEGRLTSEVETEAPCCDMDGLMRGWRRMLCRKAGETDEDLFEQYTQIGQRVVDVWKGKWQWWKTKDDGYIRDNVCRALKEAGYGKQLLWLLAQPEWIVSRLQRHGITAVEKDLNIGKEVAAGRGGGGDALVKHLEVVRRAARMSHAFVLENDKEAWFQVHGRLLSYATRCARTQQFVEDMEARAPRPWAKASLGFLQQASLDSGERDVGESSSQPQVGHTALVECVALNVDETRAATGSRDCTVRIWDLSSATVVGEALVGHSAEVRCVAWSSDGTRIASGASDGSIRVWDVESGRAVGEALVGHTDEVVCVAWSEDGTRVVSGSDDRSVRVWNVDGAHDAAQPPLIGHTDRVLCVAWNADGEHVVSGSADHSVRVWRVPADGDAQLRHTLTGHGGRVECVACSLDGRVVVSGSVDGSVRVWSVEGGELEHTLPHERSVESVGVSETGSHVVSRERFGGAARVWYVPEVQCVSRYRDAMWDAVMDALRMQRISTGRCSWWYPGSYALTVRGAGDGDGRVGTCDTQVERFGERWYSCAAFSHCSIVSE